MSDSATAIKPGVSPARRAFLAALLACALTVAAPVPSFAAEPVAVVQALYDAHPRRQQPPGGLTAWTPAMRELWKPELARPVRDARLAFDFMTASQDGRFAALELKVVEGDENGSKVRATFDNGWGAPVTLVFFLAREGDGWVMADVVNESAQGGWRLSDLLGAGQ
jgi:hypothetical protein